MCSSFTRFTSLRSNLVIGSTRWPKRLRGTSIEAFDIGCGVGGGDASRDTFETAVVAHEPVAGFGALKWEIGDVRDMDGKYEG